ncbi:hypothetical protein, partial [Gordonibacter massiliensis (ex Traore et al. 2017)]|uniref:hypothetical protein n=1 Tax=Gordonibacter massiliensis (ex Traore et al. 2017) TaxID=1841863 RepID=UPI001C8D2641
IKWILVSLICLLGYQIKPTVIIVFLAAIFIEILSLSKSRQQLKKSLAKALCIILGFAIATITSNVLIEKLGVNYNEERSFSMAHYAMMGLNCETNGCVSGEDGEFSAGKQTYQDRIEANIDVISERLDNYGILGLAKHLTKKMLCTYNDGTFGWAGEGGFFKDVVDRTSPFADLLRNIYYPSGEHYRLFCTSQQFFWIFTLMGIILNFPQILFCKESRKIASKKDSDLLVILLSIIGITLFILIFEGRARYLYLYSGFFVIASTVGFSSFANAIAFKKHNPSAQSNNSSTRVSKIQKQKTTSSF